MKEYQTTFVLVTPIVNSLFGSEHVFQDDFSLSFAINFGKLVNLL